MRWQAKSTGFAQGGKPRPTWLRALGAADPPPAVVVRGATYDRLEIFKHDSWAATALYACGQARIVVKFNRQSPLLGLPMGWLGRRLAARENAFLGLLQDLPHVPTPSGEVLVDAQPAAHAVAHAYVRGRPLQRGDRLPAEFFEDLRRGLRRLHRRGVAYMDLHKRENIIVGADGRPHFIDFQVSLVCDRRAWWSPRTWLVRWMQRGDCYHLLKHELRNGLVPAADREELLQRARPWWIRAHRLAAQPLRAFRRRLLVALSVRKGAGRASSEHFIEDGLRPVRQRCAAA